MREIILFGIAMTVRCDQRAGRGLVQTYHRRQQSSLARSSPIREMAFLPIQSMAATEIWQKLGVSRR